MFKRSLNWAWLSVAALAVLLAILVTLLRFGSPWLASWQQHWLDQVLSEQQFTLEMGELGLSWHDYGPVLVVNDIRLHQADGPTITLRRAVVDVQLWESVRDWQLVLNELTLEGLRLPIALDAQLPAEPAPEFDWRALRQFVLQGVEKFSLQDAQLLLSNRDQALLELHLPDWHWQNKPDEHQGQGWLTLSDNATQRLQVVSKFTGKPDRLSGQLYIHADGVDGSDILVRARPDDPTVNAEFNFELWLEWQQGELMAGLLDFGENRLAWGDQHQVQINGGSLQWQPTADGWQLASSQIDISVDEEVWPSWHLQLERQQDQLLGRLDRLTFTDLALLAQWGESFWPATARQLAGIVPRGQLTDLYFSANSDGSDWYWQGNLEDVSTQAFEWAAQTQGINGDFVLAAEYGALTIQQSQASYWEFDQAFRGPWPLQEINAKLAWQKQGADWLLQSEQLAIKSQDLTLEGWFSLWLPADKPPLLSASARVDVLRAGQAYRYLPEPLLGSELVDYLQGAIVQGHASGAEVIWYGQLSEFPYADGRGIFQARVPLREAEFRFDPEWQPLTDLSLDLLFENDGLYMTGNQGRLGNVNARAIEARIVPLDEDADLQLSADISGAGEAVSAYLQDSPLASSVGLTLQQVQVSGPLNAQLALTIPLAEGEVAVRGSVDFVNNTVRVTPLDLPLTQVTGRLLFDEQQTSINKLDARWLDQPLQLSYQGQETDAGYDVALNINGQWQPEKLRHSYPPLQQVSGVADWQGELALTVPDQGLVQYRFTADSNLTALQSLLPAPLNKTLHHNEPSLLTVKGDTEQAQLQWHLGAQIHGEAQLDLTKEMPHVQQLWVSAGSGVNVNLPRAPLDIAVRVPDLAINEWLALINGGIVAPDIEGSGVHWPMPYRVAVQASRAQLWQQQFNQLNATLTPAAQGQVELVLQAEQLDGRLRFGGTQAVRADFKRLWLASVSDTEKALAQTDASTELSQITVKPSQVPAIEFSCEDCRWQQMALGKVAFNLQPNINDNSVLLEQLTLDGPLLQAQASGLWLQDNSVNLSRLEWHSESPSLQRLWQAFGKESPFNETSAQLDGQLRWLAVPWQPDMATMNGQLAVKTGAGLLREVSDKGAGLLSVLSLESVLRRLRLDFRDVYEQGFYFDSIAATGQLQEGVLHNDDLRLKGAAGDLRGQGSIDLNTEQLNYNLELTPNLTGNLPVLAAFAVTPVAGLYVLALSKVLGPVVDVFTRISYQVTGSISEPSVNELGRDKKRIAVQD